MIRHSDSSLRHRSISSKLLNASIIALMVTWVGAAMSVVSKLVGADVVGAAMDVAATLVRAVVVGVAMDVVAVSGPWWRSDGGHVDDGGGPEGGLEPLFRRFLYDIMVFLGTVLSSYWGPT